MANWARDLVLGASVGRQANETREKRIAARDKKAYGKQQAAGAAQIDNAVHDRLAEVFGIEPRAAEAPAKEMGAVDTIKDFLGFGPGTPVKPDESGAVAPSGERPIDRLLRHFIAPEGATADPAETGDVADLVATGQPDRTVAGFIRTGGLAGGGRGATPTAGQAGRPDPREIYDHLVGLGVSPTHAVGALTNIAAESGYNPAAVHDNGTGYGLFGHRLDRRDKLFAHAGTDTPDWRQQLAYAVTEPEWKKYAGQDFKDDISGAASAFVRDFERPKDMAGEMRRRAQAAQNYRHYLAPSVATAPVVPIAGRQRSA
jgi:hypothetical protein